MRLGQVYSKILPHFYIRRDKRLIAHELPEKRDLIVFCPLAEKQIQAYQNLIDSDGRFAGSSQRSQRRELMTRHSIHH